MWRLKRYRGRWYAVRPPACGSPRRLALRTADRALAAQRLADLHRQPAGESVAEIYAAYVADLAARGRAPSAARAGHAWKALAPSFGALRPDQVTRAGCRLYIARRRAGGRAAGTIGKELGCLRGALRWHDRETPARVELPPRPAPRERALTRPEYRRLRLAAKAGGPHVWLFVVLALATAGRARAVLDLTWDRVDFAAGRIRLAEGAGGEGRKGRATVPMTRHARRALRLARAAATGPFVIEYGGKGVGSVRKGFESACRRAGLKGVTPHVLRHTAAVWMAEAGAGMPAIAQYLGHEDSRITERVYARYSPDYLRRAARALE